MSRCVYFFRFNSTRPMSRLQVVFRGRFVYDKNIYYTITCLFVYLATAFGKWGGRFVYDKNIYYTITCLFVYLATAFGKFRRDCLQKSDISFGDFASSCGGRLSIGNLQGHTPWVFDWSPRATSSLTA